MFLCVCVLVNDTEELGPLQTVDISNPAATKLTLKDLEAVSRYKFYLQSCTAVGCGPSVTQDKTTTAEAREYRPTLGLFYSRSSTEGSSSNPVTDLRVCMSWHY